MQIEYRLLRQDEKMNESSGEKITEEEAHVFFYRLGSIDDVSNLKKIMFYTENPPPTTN